jgi:uncharacterized membrane protein YphA (DoxX/SURF4 family)
MKTRTLTILSVLFGVMMINSGLNKFFNYMPIPEEMPALMIETMESFLQIGWLFPLVAIIEILGGAFFIFERTRALGAIMLLPITVGILLFHIIQAPENIAIALILLAINVWVIAENRARYMPMIA